MTAIVAALPAAAAALLALVSPASATPGPTTPGVSVENAAARMVVIPEARSDVSVEVQRGDPRLPVPHVRQEGARIVVDGGLAGRIASCGSIGIDWRVFGPGRRDQSDPHVQRVMVRGVGPLTLDRLPQITAHVPLRSGVAVGTAVFGRVGRSEALAFANSGCGDWTIEDVSGPLDVAVHGSGDVHAGRAGVLHAALSGSGDLYAGDVDRQAAIATRGSADTHLGRVGGALTAEMAGSGDLRAREVQGVVAARQSGSGDVVIEGGRASSVSVQTAGSGDFTFRGEAGAVAAQTSGSGDITVAHASGPVSQARSGSGEIHIGR